MKQKNWQRLVSLRHHEFRFQKIQKKIDAANPVEIGKAGKPVPVKVQMVVTQSSFFLLVGLSVLLIIRDTSQLLIVQRLLNQ